MFPRVLLAALALTWAPAALAQSSASFPDLPGRAAAPAPSAAAPQLAPAERPEAQGTGVREPTFGTPAFQSSGGSAFAPSFVSGPAPAFAPTFAPSAPARDAAQGEAAESRSSPTLVLVGGLVLGIPYATGVGIGASESFDNGSGWLAAPVLGPWLAMSGRRDPCAESQQKQEFDSDVGKCVGEPLVRGMLVLDGVLQATGAVMMIIGATSGGPSKPRREPPPLIAAPTPMGRTGYGFAVAGAF